MRCIVCGKDADPTESTLFRLAGRPLCVAHTTECAPLIRKIESGATEVTRELVTKRFPSLLPGLEMAGRIFSAVRGENHGR